MKILILTGKFGMGHYSASNSLSEEIRNQFADADVFVEDIFMHTLQRSCGAMYGAFSFLVKKGSRIYNLVYKRIERPDKQPPFPLMRRFCSVLALLIENTGAEVVISTYPFCSRLVSEYKKSTGRKIPLITCITDVTCHSQWLHPETDLYLTAAPEIKKDLIQRGVAPERILVSGIPVHRQFLWERGDCSTAKKHLLIMGGGLGLLPRAEAFYRRLNQLPHVQTTIITGNNKALYRTLKNKYPNISVLEFVEDVHRHMQNADLIISKPGGITLFEAIFSELPLLLFSPFLEHEIRNGEFVRENQLGIVLSKKPEASVGDIQEILCNDEQLNNIRSNMRRFKSGLDHHALTRALLQFGAQRAL
ncbi:MAG: glycosyltransferase [Clostridia bacterium]|jgi:UDP-N-acetylglucosamine:LPS N-acetylglucosamine transferase|nr:glycosyltransferase [Clostridia bacterium]